MVELVDTPDLGSGAARYVGSSPILGIPSCRIPLRTLSAENNFRFSLMQRFVSLALLQIGSSVFGLINVRNTTLKRKKSKGDSMLLKKLSLPPLAALLLFNGCLTAEESTETHPEISIEGHVPVRSRDMDPVKRELMDRLRAKEAEEAEKRAQAGEQQGVQRASNAVNGSGSQFLFAPSLMSKPKISLASSYGYAFPINCHSLISISDSFRSVEIEDGSFWDISPMDCYVLRNWRRGDSLCITPNSSWLCPYDYYITNKSDSNSYVRANLSPIGPKEYGPFSHWVVDIDYFGGHVYLENKMIWCVDPQDMYILREWQISDHIIFGKHDSWFSPYDHILINVNMDNFIHVKQY